MKLTGTLYLMQLAEKFSDRSFTVRVYVAAGYMDGNQNKSNAPIGQYQKAIFSLSGKIGPDS